MTATSNLVDLGSPTRADPEGPSVWGAVVTLRYPEGTVRHPRVLDSVAADIGRFCLIDNRDEGVRVSFETSGETFDEARDDSAVIATRLLTMLGLPAAAVVEHDVRRSAAPTDDAAGPSLYSVPEPGDAPPHL